MFISAKYREWASKDLAEEYHSQFIVKPNIVTPFLHCNIAFSLAKVANIHPQMDNVYFLNSCSMPVQKM